MEFTKPNNKNTNNPIFLLEKNMNTLSMNICESQALKRYSTSFVIREMEMKSTMRCHHTLLRVVKF